MTPDLPPVPPGRWLPLPEATAALGVKERTVYRRVAQGRLQRRYDSHGHVQVYVPDTGHAPGPDTTLTIRQAVMTEIAQPFLQRNAEQETIIRQQAEEIGQLREQLAVLKTMHEDYLTKLEAEIAHTDARLAELRPWWRALWARLSGRAP